MARHWLCLALVPAVAVAQPPAVMPTPPPPGAAAPPSAVVPLGPQKPFEWPTRIGDRSIEHWIGELTNADPTVRMQAANTLPYFGQRAARQASRQLLGLFADPDPGVRVNAILAVTGIGFDSKEDAQRAVTALRSAITNTSPGSVIRLHAARCLGTLGAEAHPAVEVLAGLTKEPAWETRDAAASALGRAGAAVYDTAPVPPGGPPPQPKRPASPTARMRLTELLKDPSKAVRLEAIQSLILLGPPTVADPTQYVKEATPFIDAVLVRLAPGTDKAPGETDPSVRLWLHTLVLMYDDRQAGPAVREMAAAVTATDPAVRIQGLTALTVCGPLAARALEEVRAALRAPEPAVAKAAVACLFKMGPEARKAVGDLQSVAADTPDKELKEMAEEVARRLQPGAVPVKK